ncbi:hypothetical protein ACIOZM_23835 [Pseudomonas sp. NPDC087346]
MADILAQSSAGRECSSTNPLFWIKREDGRGLRIAPCSGDIGA